MSAESLLAKLPGDVQAVLDLDRELPGLGDDVQRRLRQRLEVSVGILALGVGTSAVASTTAVASAGTVSATAVKVGLFAKPWIVAGVAFVLGGLTGAGLYASLRKPVEAPAQVTTVVVEKRVEVPVPMAIGNAVAPSSADTSKPVAGVGAPSSVPSTLAPNAFAGSSSSAVGTVAGPKSSNVAATTDTGLAAERGLLEVARTALSRGDAASAISSLDEHAKRFPGGALTEEREALYVQALARAGRLDEAKARAAKFAKRFPGSMLLPVVEAATE